MPKVILAAILEQQRRALVIDEIEPPERLQCGQVLVKVLCTSICGSQIGEIDGVKGPDRFLPHLLGHEGCGEVLAAGDGVRYVRTGDRVVLHWRKGRGIEAAPAGYRWRGKPLNAGFVTTFSDYAVVSENRLTAIPNDFNPHWAALFGCAVTTAFGILDNNAGLKIGESIVVLGTGGVGLSVVQGAALRAACPIVAVDRFDNRLDLAMQLGATHRINAGTEALEPRLRQIFGDQGVDVAVENTGDPDIIALAYRMTGPTGRTVLVGVPRADQTIAIHSLPLHFGKVLTGSHGGQADPAVDIPRYVRLCLSGRLCLEPLLTDRFALENINEAIARMRDGRIAGRCLIEPR